MHVLTKIFVVLVALLAIVLTPLVVVYAHNEDSFKARYEREQNVAAAASANLKQAEARHGAEVSRLQAELDQSNNTIAQKQAELDQSEATIRRLQSDLASARTLQGEIRSEIGRLATALEAAQKLTENLIAEVREVRSEAMAAVRKNVELDEALRDVSGQLEVADAARRALEEELQRTKEELAAATGKVREYVASFGELAGGPARGGMFREKPATHDVAATVISVRRGPDQVLAEIDAGSVDGVEEGWVFVVSVGETFIGNLRIIRVDMNRSTGVVELEKPSRGRVQIGYQAKVEAGGA